jgi:hypothetical protein
MRNILRPTLFTILIAVCGSALAQSGPYSYYALTPCRAVDTRGSSGTNGGPIFGADSTRNFQIRGVCGVPAGAKAVSLNLTIVNATQSSFLTVWPSNLARPFVSMLNFEAADPSLANGVLVGLSSNTQDLSVYNNSGNVHVIIDVTGYFQ